MYLHGKYNIYAHNNSEYTFEYVYHVESGKKMVQLLLDYLKEMQWGRDQCVVGDINNRLK